MTFAELVDKLAIDQIKETLLPEEQVQIYASEIKCTEHDINLIINQKGIELSAEFIRMLILLAQANLHIWFIKDQLINESDSYAKLLKFAQELNNGIRNHLKNVIMEETGEATPATKKTTFLSYKSDEWYTKILENLKVRPIENEV